MTKKEREELYDEARREFIESPEGITVSALARKHKGVNYNTLMSRANREKWADARNMYMLNARKATENLSILAAAQPRTTKVAISAMEAGIVRGAQLLKAMTMEGQPLSASKHNIALYAQVGNTLSNLIRTAGDVGILEQIQKPDKAAKNGETGESGNGALDPTILQQINIHLMQAPQVAAPKVVEKVLEVAQVEDSKPEVIVEDDDDLVAGDV